MLEAIRRPDIFLSVKAGGDKRVRFQYLSDLWETGPESKVAGDSDTYRLHGLTVLVATPYDIGTAVIIVGTVMNK